jgi:hypothetical protein
MAHTQTCSIVGENGRETAASRIRCFLDRQPLDDMDDPSTSCAVLEEPVGAEGQQPDLIADADTFCIVRFAHNQEVGHHGVEFHNP